jgi:hypothetical protein
MKTRKGFVSNSSSSSFILDSNYLIEKFGYEWEDKVREKIKLLAEVYEEHERPIDDMMTISKTPEAVEAFHSLASRYANGHYSEEEGDVIINSRGNNSIPWPIQEYIEYELWGSRYHWG